MLAECTSIVYLQKIYLLENRLYDREETGIFNNNKCMIGTYHDNAHEKAKKLLLLRLLKIL